MRIVQAETIHADGGYRPCSYLKLTTDDGIVGWSEYYDDLSGARIDPLIHGFVNTARDLDPIEFGRLSGLLHATTRLAAGGLGIQAISAVENACLDIAGKALRVPVHTLLGGAFRQRIALYWTHCGSFRVARERFFVEQLGYDPIKNVDDLAAVAREAVAQGYRSVKTNPVYFDFGRPQFFSGGFILLPGMMDRSITDRQLGAIHEQMLAFRQVVGPDIGVMLDVSFSQSTEGYLRIARRLEDLNLEWLEIDVNDFGALRLIRDNCSVPIASLESLHGLAEYRPFLEHRCADTCIIDAMWNGVWQSSRIATIAEAYDTMIAPHNPVGDLGTLMSGHLAAATANFKTLEYRADEAPWTREFLTHPLEIDNGELILPNRPGWGSDIDEAALRSRPVKPAY